MEKKFQEFIKTESFKSIIRTIQLIFKEKTNISIIDLGCRRGEYSVGLSKLGYNVTGIEARQGEVNFCNKLNFSIRNNNMKILFNNLKLSFF